MVRLLPPSALPFLAVVLAGLPLAASAASPGADKTESARRQMQDAERARAAEIAAQKQAVARADAATSEQQRLAGERVAAAAHLRAAEAATADAVTRMDALTARRQDAEAKLQARAADFTPLLPMIERLSLYPAETMLAVPAPPDDAVRGVLVLQGIAREIEQQAEAVRQEQATLDEATRAVQAEEPRLAAAQATQAAQAASLDRQIAATQNTRRAAEGEAAEAARRAADLAARAGSLRAAIAEIDAAARAAEAQAREQAAREERARREAERRGGPGGRVQAADRAAPPVVGPMRGRLVVPVAGTIIRAWGTATDAGPATGVSYQTPPGAHVVSPCGGRVVFAAPFRSYGLLLITDCGGGYHFVLAGLDRLDVFVGNPVQAGEPVGVMPAWDPRAPGSRPALYVELRRDGQPVNPAPMLGARS